MKKFFIPILLSILVSACQKDSLTVKDDAQESSFLQDTQLMGLMTSVAAHDGSFDDVIDASDCFSINLPYRILLNGEPHEINTIEDLLIVHELDIVTPIFPIDITFGDYNVGSVSTINEFQALINLCASGELYNERITCVDFVYPVSIAVYEPSSDDFETIVFDHDRQTFLTLGDFQEGTLASINFPISILVDEKVIDAIEDIEDLKQALLLNAVLCE